MTNATEINIVSELLSNFSSLPGISVAIKILQTAGIIFIIYITFLFIKGILQYKKLSKISKMDKKLEEINNTLKKIDSKLGKVSKKRGK